MSSTWTLKPGVDFVYDGDACTVAAMVRSSSALELARFGACG